MAPQASTKYVYKLPPRFMVMRKFTIESRAPSFPLAVQPRSAETLLDRLHPETLSEIATYLREPEDLINFCKSCKSAEDVILNDSSLWTRLLSQAFDTDFNPRRVSIEQRRSVYLARMDVHKPPVSPKTNMPKPHPIRGDLRVNLLRHLMLEAHNGKGMSKGRNMQWIEQHIDQHWSFNDCYLDDLEDIKDGKLLIQVMVSYLRFRKSPDSWRPSPRSKPVGFRHPLSQVKMYDLPVREPLFQGKELLEVNMPWLLHCLNFWVRTFCAPSSDLYFAYDALGPHRQISPSGWNKPIMPGSSRPGKHFIGDYAWCSEDDRENLRAGLRALPDVLDISQFNADATLNFQTMDITYHNFKDPAKRAFYWPQAFEDFLDSERHDGQSITENVQGKFHSLSEGWCHSMYPRHGEYPVVAKPSPPADMKNQQFTATGLDHGEPYFATGWITPLPAQASLPGFQRFVMVKFSPHDWFKDPSAADDADDDDYYTEGKPDPPLQRHIEAALADPFEGPTWGYEGVVLPGDHMILGRWFPMHELDPATEVNPRSMVGLHDDGELLDSDYSDPDLEVYLENQARTLTGPFMFWAVEPEGEVESNDHEDEDDDEESDE